MRRFSFVSFYPKAHASRVSSRATALTDRTEENSYAAKPLHISNLVTRSDGKTPSDMRLHPLARLHVNFVGRAVELFDEKKRRVGLHIAT